MQLNPKFKCSSSRFWGLAEAENKVYLNQEIQNYCLVKPGIRFDLLNLTPNTESDNGKGAASSLGSRCSCYLPDCIKHITQGVTGTSAKSRSVQDVQNESGLGLSSNSACRDPPEGLPRDPGGVTDARVRTAERGNKGELKQATDQSIGGWEGVVENQI